MEVTVTPFTPLCDANVATLSTNHHKHPQYILARVIPYVFPSKPNEELYYNVFNLLLIAICLIVVHILGQAIQFIVTIHMEKSSNNSFFFVRTIFCAAV